MLFFGGKMSHNVIEFDEQCKACKGTGLYFGLAEKDGAAVICQICKGTGCRHVKIEYDDFEGRKTTEKCERVFETNPGIVIGRNKEEFELSDFGGMFYKEWVRGLPFPAKSENRKFICPAWWYQSADYYKKPDWNDKDRKCIFTGSFSKCDYFKRKNECWERWDREYGNGK